MSQATIQQAWNKGYDAGCALQPSESNPYKDSSKLYEAWEDGWREGIDPDREEKERDQRNS